jgi:tRNA(fMet)-specific endonuclease VapC
LIIWPYDESAAREFGMLFSELRSRGRPMQQVDIQIAAISLTLGNCTVITKDSDFAAIARLPIENWIT